MTRVAHLAARHRRALGAVAGAIAVAGGVVAATMDGPDHLDRARAELADRRAFLGATTAGEALLRASVELQQAGRECNEGDAACSRLLTASAMARVSSVRVLSCRRPQIHEFREGFATFLDELDAGHDPTPPIPPSCD